MIFSLSWFKFTLLNAFLITLLNFNLFSFFYEKSQSIFMLILFICAYFFLINAIFSLLFFKFLSKFFSILFIIISFLCVYFISSYGILIDSDMLQNVAKTDTKEVKELLNFKLFLITLLALFLSLCILKLKITAPSFKLRFINFSLSLVLAFAILFIFSKTFFPFFRNYNEIRMYNVPFYQIYSVYRYYTRFIKPKPEFQSIAKDAILPTNSQKRILILIVGETARAANYSLGDYSKNLTNEFTPHEGVIFFNKFYSCGTATAKSVPCMFSSSKSKTHSNSEYAENVLDVLQRLGIKVTWLDNNSGGCQGVCERLKNVRNFSNEFDGFLIEEVKKELDSLENMELVVVHLQGSHGPTYYKRYPKEFAKFSPTCDTNELQKCTKEELINTYDNTILYTDHVVEEIIDEAKAHTEFLSSVIYVSDHGESLGENGVYLHGMPYLLAPEFQTHIPLIFWSNDTTLNKNAFDKRHYKLSHDNLFSSLLGFFGVQTSFYEKEYDLFSKELKPNLD